MHDEREDCHTLQRSLQLLTVLPPARRRTRQDRATVVALGAHTIGKECLIRSWQAGESSCRRIRTAVTLPQRVPRASRHQGRASPNRAG
jgi:hypothetical protein